MAVGLSIPQGGGFLEKAQQFKQSAIGAYSSQIPSRKTQINPPGKTLGGGLSAGAGYGVAGYTIGSSIGAGAGTVAAGLSDATVAAGTMATGTAAGSAVTGAGAGGSSAGWYGALIGAGIGLLSYYLS
jgi:hypothetical protein